MKRTTRALLMEGIAIVVAVGALVVAPSKGSTEESQNVAKVIEAVPFMNREHEYRRAQVQYDFRPLAEIEITGLGRVAPQGSVKHIWWNKKLEFFDPGRHKLLATLELVPTVQLQGAGPELPAENEFNVAESRYRIPVVARPADVFRAALNATFPLGYAMKELDGVTSYVTTYQELAGVPKNTLAELAVRLSFPSTLKLEDEFRLGFVVRERRRKSISSKWYPPQEDSMRAAKEFLERIRQNIEKAVKP